LCELCLSILHFAINTFNHFCKVGAKIKAKVKQYKAYGEVKQGKIALAMDRIKKNFDELGLNMFDKRRGGSNTDGNTVRRAFANIPFFAQNVGVSEELLWRFNVIRIALASTLKKVCYYHFQNLNFSVLSNMFFDKIHKYKISIFHYVQVQFSVSVFAFLKIHVFSTYPIFNVSEFTLFTMSKSQFAIINFTFNKITKFTIQKSYFYKVHNFKVLFFMLGQALIFDKIHKLIILSLT